MHEALLHFLEERLSSDGFERQQPEVQSDHHKLLCDREVGGGVLEDQVQVHHPRRGSSGKEHQDQQVQGSDAAEVRSQIHSLRDPCPEQAVGVVGNILVLDAGILGI